MQQSVLSNGKGGCCAGSRGQKQAALVLLQGQVKRPGTGTKRQPQLLASCGEPDAAGKADTVSRRSRHPNPRHLLPSVPHGLARGAPWLHLLSSAFNMPQFPRCGYQFAVFVLPPRSNL